MDWGMKREEGTHLPDPLPMSSARLSVLHHPVLEHCMLLGAGRMVHWHITHLQGLCGHMAGVEDSSLTLLSLPTRYALCLWTNRVAAQVCVCVQEQNCSPVFR